MSSEPKSDAAGGSDMSDDRTENTVSTCRKEFDEAFYLTKYPDILNAKVNPFDHYFRTGWREGRWPNDWFDPEKYCAAHPEIDPKRMNPFLHFLTNRDKSEQDLAGELERVQKNKLLLFTDAVAPLGEEGRQDPAVVMNVAMPPQDDIEAARAYFDAEYYLEENPDLAARGVSPLLHFLTIGWIEGRNPSADFSTDYYIRHNRDIREQRINPFLHYVRSGRHEGWRKTATVAEARILRLFENDAELQQQIEEAKALEPMVALPQGQRTLSHPALNFRSRIDVYEGLRRALGGRRFRYVVTVPHVRMSGAARVAAIFCSQLAGLRDLSEILLVTTDSSEREYMGWFPPGLQLFDLSSHTAGLDPENQQRALIDVLRGVGAEAVINVNSRLFWETLISFGRQVSQDVRVVTYLFTWDETETGDRVGYPVQWMRHTAPYHHLILTDTRNLATDISDRFGFGALPGEADIVSALYTPAQPLDGQAHIGIARGERPRVLWAGRFDRQKRLDVLVDIARANPDFVFDVYGKPVLDQKGLDAYDPPGNIVYKGLYRDMGEVLETPYLGFLYTSQWDGMPTVLLDAALAGLPIIAPDVGGISELVDRTTGWLIADFRDVDGYSAALADLRRDQAEGETRAKRMKARIQARFSDDIYSGRLKEIFEKNGI